jgi:hypothetical protein
MTRNTAGPGAAKNWRGWLDFYSKVLPGLMPKKTGAAADGKTVIILEATLIQKPPNSGLGEEEKKK